MKYFLIILLLFTISLNAQYSLKGKVNDSDGLPLSGANILITGTEIGTSTNLDGEFSITNIKDRFITIRVSMVGYSTVISEDIDLSKDNEINFTLSETVFNYGQIVVTGNKRPQQISSLPVSAAVINSVTFFERNYTQLDEALRYTPGVSFVLDQVSIRGSSGYSRGAGTRVFVSLDGIPLSSGDSGEIIWETVPVTEIDRVEVIKGAASTLYGSNALGGVINVLSKEVSSKPVTHLKTYFGLYDKPAHDEWDWSGQYRGFNGLTLSHSNKFDKLGISASFSRLENMSYRQGDWRKRYSAFLKAKYNFTDNVSLTLLGTGYLQDKGVFNYWKNLNNALVPPDADQGQTLPSQRLVGGIKFNHKLNDKFSYSVLGNIFRSIWKDDSESGNNSNSTLSRIEFQNIYVPFNDFVLTSGIELSNNNVASNIFGNNKSNAYGIYAQAEYKLDIPLTLTAGIRFDNTKPDSISAMNSFSPKVGLNYKLSAQTILRAYFGKGFRAPTLAEAFTSTTTSGVTVKPNLNLKAETNTSLEAGIKHSFSNYFVVDFALFHNDYFDLIEPIVDSDSKIYFGNVTRARIQGSELNFSFKIKELNTDFSVGHTYLWARDVENEKALRYRPRNTVYVEGRYSNGNFSFSTNFRYLSKIEELDWELVELGIVPDGDNMVEIYTVDLSVGYSFFSAGIPLRTHLNINNLFNYNYVEMIGNISPIRNVSLNLELMF